MLRKAPRFSCLAGHRVSRADASIGYCGACGGFPGLCAAGRSVVRADLVIYDVNWLVQCPARGAAPWRIEAGGVVLLCAAHDADVRTGAAWLGAGCVPLG